MAEGRAVAIVLEATEKSELAALTRRHGAPQALAERARIILAAASGLNNKEIAEFCRTTYGVQFPLYEKTTVTDLARNPLYRQLVGATGQSPKWNFHKYLIDRDGHVAASFVSGMSEHPQAG